MTVEMMKSLYHKHEDIKRKESILNNLKERLKHPKIIEYKEKIQSTGVSKIVEREVVRIIEFEDSIKSMKKDYGEIRQQVIEHINSIDNALYRDILELRYVQFEKWEDIAKILGYSRQHIYNLHKKALVEIDKK